MMCNGNCQQGRECTCVPEIERLQSDLLHAQQDNAMAEAALWARVETAETDRDYWKHCAEVAEAADQEHFNQLMTALRERDEARAEVARLRERFRHIHVNNGQDDSCKQCGLDLRNPIHAARRAG